MTCQFQFLVSLINSSTTTNLFLKEFTFKWLINMSLEFLNLFNRATGTVLKFCVESKFFALQLTLFFFRNLINWGPDSASFRKKGLQIFNYIC